MFAKYGCDSKLSLQLEQLLSNDKEQRYDEIQKFSFYFLINSSNLNQIPAKQLIVMPENDLIKGSKAEQVAIQEAEKRDLYEELQRKDLSNGKLKCKCGSALQCSVEQRRSADEGATAIMSCTNPKCNVRWKW